MTASGSGRGRKPRPGRITFVGSGPGDPGLLTTRARTVLANATCVFTDPDVPAAVLNVVGSALGPAVGPAPAPSGDADGADPTEQMVAAGPDIRPALGEPAEVAKILLAGVLVDGIELYRQPSFIDIRREHLVRRPSHWRKPTAPVHPHVRGDGSIAAMVARFGAGSPPRVWGRQDTRPSYSARGRFTPTCVGTATCTRRDRRRCSVHPHVRGDGDVFVGRVLDDVGSPPRAWGRHLSGTDLRNAYRFTPTCVGTAQGDDGSPDARHGSPPRAWGRPVDFGRLGARTRFTPTCVGTACRPTVALGGFAVHPHVRGDGTGKAAVMEGFSGSPPRAWGRPNSACPGADVLRFTPTCVGTARPPELRLDRQTVHPHVRGDGAYAAAYASDAAGSPPRAWGRQMEIGSGLHEMRFTPTCVGTARANRCRQSRATVHPHVRGDGDRGVARQG